MAPVTGHNPVRAALGIPLEEILVLYAGNLGRKQGLETLLDAAALLGHGIHVAVVGDGAEREALVDRAKTIGATHVRFLPLVSEADLPALLSAGDIHVITQKAAAAELVLPSKILNIMAAAKPVVVTAEAGTALAEVVVGAECGLVVDPDAPMALAGAIRILEGDAQARRRMGDNGRRYVVLTFSRDAVLRRLEILLRWMISCSRGAR